MLFSCWVSFSMLFIHLFVVVDSNIMSPYTLSSIRSPKRVVIRQIDYNLTLLDQPSSNKIPRLPSQNMTDLYHSPVLKVTDDFIIPPMSTFIVNNIPYGIDNCRSLYFSIFYFRSKNDQDPKNIVLYLMNNKDDSPGDVFFEKTYKMPLNGWNINVYDPSTLLLRVSIGEIDDYGREFDMSSSSMNYGTRIWVSVYVSMERKFSFTGFKENVFYWVIYKIPEYKALIPGELDSPYIYYNKTLPYYFMDNNNFLNKSLVKWTIASDTERRFNLEKTSSNMAWRVFLLCKQTIFDTDINFTDSPSVTPTPTTQPNNTLQPNTPIHNNTDNNGDNNKDVLYILIIVLIIVFLCSFYGISVLFRKYYHKNEYSEDFTQVMKDKGDEFYVIPYEPTKSTITLDGNTPKDNQRSFIQSDKIEVIVEI